MTRPLGTVGGREMARSLLPQFTGLLESFFCLLSLPSLFSLLPSLPLLSKGFYFSLMVGVPKRVLATPGVGLVALPSLRGHHVLSVPVLHRAPPAPGGAPVAPDPGPGCSSSLPLQSLLMWGWSSSWGDLWVLWVLPVHL